MFKLNMPLMRSDHMDTELSDDALLELYASALPSGFGRPPRPEARSSPITASQRTFIDLVEEGSGGEDPYDGIDNDDSAAEDLDGSSLEENDSGSAGSDDNSE